ncbi:MAG: hypothetical protein Q3M24_10800 [Candidatus Electrothrix aestuarii]|jgi:hypothetical protein|uniref:Uncharacterized protein n=1 Tax=Candidatus Electrothrix aestuarii TaxID=3062594 RepID=A0AAU8M165_9BACT|nr:hypothetical protein [Candidatus Electrothrix aestuarii]
MQQWKKISIRLGLAVSLAAFAGLNNAQAQNISLPLPANAPEITSVINSVKMDVGPDSEAVKAIMRQTRDNIKEQQAKRLPLMPVFRNTIGNAVSTRVMAATRTATMNAQMTAMQDPVSPDAVPTMIAPKFE